MTTITTRSGKGSPLTNNEVDANFTNLNDDKVETSGDSMTGNLSFGDNNKAIFGAGSDLEIYHDASHSYIVDAGTGNMYLSTNGNGIVMQASLSETMFAALPNGSVRLYHDNSQKLETTSTGIDVTGVITTDGMTTSADINFGDNDKAVFGASSDLQIYHTSTESFIQDSGTGSLFIDTDGTAIQLTSANSAKNMITAVKDGAVTLFHNNSAKLATTTTGIDVTGTITFDGGTTTANVNFGDNDRAIFGAGSDLQIYHDGSNSYVKDSGTGDLMLQGVNVRIQGATTGNNMFVGLDNGASTLYHQNNAKLATTSTGIDVTGVAVVDGLTSSAAITSTSNSNSLGGTTFTSAISGTTANMSGSITVSGNSNTIGGTTFSSNIDVTGTVTSDGLTVDGTATVAYTTAATANRTYGLIVNGDDSGTVGESSSIFLSGLNATTRGASIAAEIQSAGNDHDLIFATSASGSTPAERMRIDASGNVGIGTTSPTFTTGSGLEIQRAGAATLRLEDTGSSGKPFEIYSDDGEGYVVNGIGSGMPMIFKTVNAERMRIDASGAVLIHPNNATRGLKITSTTTGTAGDTTTYDTIAAGFGRHVFKTDGTERVRIDQSGKIKAQTAGGYYLTESSTDAFSITSNGANGKLAITDEFNSAERLTILQSGNVGINTTSPAATLHTVANSGTTALLTVGASGNNIASFYTSGSSQVMTLDSSGNLLVGSTEPNPAQNNTSDAISLHNAGLLRASTTNAAAPLDLNVKSRDGDIAQFRKDGTLIGEIGTGSGDLYIGTGDTTIRFADGNDAIIPRGTAGASRDGAIDLGLSNNRFKDLYLSGNAYIGNAVTAGTDGSISLVLEGAAHIFRKGSAGSFAEYGRFDASGNLLVGTTSSSVYNTTGDEGVAIKTNNVQIQRASDVPLFVNRTTSDGGIISIRKDGSVVGSISVTSSATTYNTSSDQRLKDNIVDAPSASDDIDAIQVRSFDWKADGSHQKYGMVAQELQSVAPEAVSGGETEEDMMGVDYSKLVPMMMKEIQSLRARVAQLEGAN